MPNILVDCEAEETGYFGFQGLYASAFCPVCHSIFYYNQKYYPDKQPPTCSRYACLKAVFSLKGG